MTEPIAHPVTGTERIASIDVLRGVAVLGILLMNIVTFSMVLGTYSNPAVYGDLSGADWWTWLILHVVAEQKFMTIFSLLFGAGVCIFMERAEAKGASAWRPHLTRMAWLLFFGLAHAYLLWYGDILVTYAVCGVAVAVARKWAVPLQISIGVVMVCVPIALMLVLGLTIEYWPPDILAETRSRCDLSSEVVAAEIAAYQGDWLMQMGHRVPTSLMMHVALLPLMLFWRAAGVMLIGMAAYRCGVLSAARSRCFYIAMMVLGVGIGLPLILRGVQVNSASGWDPVTVDYLGGIWNFVASLFMAAAWVGLIMLVCRSGVLASARRVLAAVGRMAFTNYLGQTVICTTLFYGHGLGWFGSLERVELLGVVASVWAFQMIFSVIWLRFFRFGPMEWLWRSLTYLELQPMRL